MSARFPIETFPPLVWLTGQWPVLAREALALSRDILPVDREGGGGHGAVLQAILSLGRNGWTESWGPSKAKWLTYGYRYMDLMAADILNDRSHPETVRILRRLSGIKVCALSLFSPGAYLQPHAHLELGVEGVLTYHLGLKVPEWCYLYTDGLFIPHKTGEAVIFDGSKHHFAFNFSAEERLILYIEFFKDRITLSPP